MRMNGVYGITRESILSHRRQVLKWLAFFIFVVSATEQEILEFAN